MPLEFTMTLGCLALARPTFDVPFAEATAARAFAALDRAGIRTLGPRSLMFDAAAATAALADLRGAGASRLLLLQVTFTDASMTVEVADAFAAPLAIWAFPEPRAGGRLRLNSFCGLNLALHALGRAGRQATYLYADPDSIGLDDGLRALLASPPRAAPVARALPHPTAADQARAEGVLAALRGATLGLVGEHPTGFDTCRFDEAALHDLAGVSVARIPLGEVFERARAAPVAAVAATRGRIAELAGLDAVDQPQLEKSLTVYHALKAAADERRCAGLAVRCWPEMFTEYGCAACGPMGLLNGERLPAACEADVYGALTQRLLQDLAEAPAWLVDVVDMDTTSDTSVLWHCGSAPLTMRDPDALAEAQIHSNRRMPLLAQFPLKPGRVTLARLTQARDQTRLVIAGGEVLRAPISFTGTSAVLRFDGGTEAAMRGLLDHALEHHLALVYGDHRASLVATADRLGIPAVSLT
jgi:L-fucose isomerase-like protein